MYVHSNKIACSFFEGIGGMIRMSHILCFRHMILDSKVSPFMSLIKIYLLLVDSICP